jgi:hypothetical protein
MNIIWKEFFTFFYTDGCEFQTVEPSAKEMASRVYNDGNYARNSLGLH